MENNATIADGRIGNPSYPEKLAIQFDPALAEDVVTRALATGKLTGAQQAQFRCESSLV